MNKYSENDLIRRGDAMRAVLHNDGDAARGAIAEIPPMIPGTELRTRCVVRNWKPFTPDELPTKGVLIEPDEITSELYERTVNLYDALQELRDQLPERPVIRSVGATIAMIYRMKEQGASDEEIRRFINEDTVFGTKEEDDDQRR